jgi:hypothetical protein
MSPPLLDQIVEAVLYEGYILYPYRPSSRKNRRERFTFGRVYPEAYSAAQKGAEPWWIQTECLVQSTAPGTALDVSVRFLQPMAREVGRKVRSPKSEVLSSNEHIGFQIVPELRVDDQVLQPWLEAVERTLRVADGLEIRAQTAESPPITTPVSFVFRSSTKVQVLQDKQGEQVGVIVRRTEDISGVVETTVARVSDAVYKVTVRIFNQTPMRAESLSDGDAVLMRTLASTHTILRVTNGEFISLMAPPAGLEEAVAACKNIGTWPVLVGDEAKPDRDTMLSSPIILYDYPRIAPESAGQLFDGTEIDEILTLRVLTMTDAEKREMRSVDDHARRLLERTERLPESALLNLHGTIRQVEPSAGAAPPPIDFDDFFGPSTALQGVSVKGVYLKTGDRVRLRPKARADVMDLALEGRTAVIEAVEQDLEKRVHLAVVLEDDPGKDLGMLRQPGHRFFYGVDEIEPLTEALK